MKKISILTVLVMILAVNAGNAHAFQASKLGPRTIYNPDIAPMPLRESKSVFPSII